MYKNDIKKAPSKTAKGTEMERNQDMLVQVAAYKNSVQTMQWMY